MHYEMGGLNKEVATTYSERAEHAVAMFTFLERPEMLSELVVSQRFLFYEWSCHIG